MTASLTPAAETARYIDSLGPEALAKAQAYTSGSNWITVLGVVVSVGIAWLLIRSGLLDRLARRFEAGSWALGTFVVGAAFLLLSDLISLPWTIYTSWQREHAYGLSRQPLGDFLGQFALSEAIGMVLGGLFLLGVYALIRRTGPRWWVWSGGLAAIAVLFILLAVPSLIMPLFNKFEPVPPGQVRTALEAIADRVDIPHERIFLYDGSRQSENFTANVAGIGPSARIAISDVAMKKASLDEVKAVTGHEAGHYKLGHAWRSAMVMPLLAILFFWLVNRLFTPAARMLGCDAQLHEPRGIPVFMAIGAVLGLLLTPGLNGLTRIGESEADAYSLATVGLPDALASALIKTAEYRYPRPGPLQEAIFYSHPSVEKRVLRAMEWKAEHAGVKPPAP